MCAIPGLGRREALSEVTVGRAVSGEAAAGCIGRPACLHWHGDGSHQSGPAFRQLDRDVSLDVVGSIFSTFPLPLYYQPYLEKAAG